MTRAPARGGALGVAFIALLVVAAAPAAARAADGTDALRLIPAESDAVISVNVDRLRHSPHYNAVAGWLRQQGDFSDGARLLEERAGFDLDKDLSTLVFAGEVKGESDDDFTLFMQGRYDRERVMKVARESGTTGQHRKITYVATKEGVALAVLGKYLVVAPSVERMKKVIDVHRHKARPIKRNRKMMTLIRHTDTSRDVWLVLMVGPKIKQGLGGVPMMSGVRAFGASVDLKSGLGVRVRLATESAQAASTLGQSLEQAAKLGAGDPNLGPIFGKLGVATQRAAVKLSLDLTDSELSSLVGSVGL